MPWDTVSDLVRITQEAVPWAIPLVEAGIVAGVVVGLWLHRRLGARAWLIAALIASVALVVALTLTPNAGGPDDAFTDPRPDKGAWGYLLAPQYWFHLDSRSLNVALFIPLGLTLALLTRGRVRWIILALGLAMPWLVEGLQSLLPFNRDPQVIDLVDNSTGFVVGWLLGYAVAAARDQMSVTLNGGR